MPTSIQGGKLTLDTPINSRDKIYNNALELGGFQAFVLMQGELLTELSLHFFL